MNSNNPLGYSSTEPTESSNMTSGNCTSVGEVGLSGVLPADLTTDQVPEGSNNLYFTAFRAKAGLSATAPIKFNRDSGVISHAEVPGMDARLYGSDTKYPVFTLDKYGHITAITEQTLSLGGGTPYTLPQNLVNLNAVAGTGFLTKTGTESWKVQELRGMEGRTKVAATASYTLIDLEKVGEGGEAGSTTEVPKIFYDEYGRITKVELKTIQQVAPTPVTLLTLPELINQESGTNNPSVEGDVLQYTNGVWSSNPVASTFVTTDQDAHFALTGKLGIGVDAPAYKLDVLGDGQFSGDVIAFSDERVKENIHTIPEALQKVLALRGVTYTRTDQEDKSEKMGVIAQEVQKIVPQVVHEAGDMLGVSYGNLVGLLIEAMKEQQAQINILTLKLSNYAPK